MKILFTREIKIGIMVIVGLAALVFGVNYLNGINILTPSNSYYIKYEYIGSLEKSAPVIIKGYKVGQVREIYYNFEDKEPFTVTISLDNELKIPVGSTIELIDDGFVGSKILQINFAQNKLKNEYYKQGDTICSLVGKGFIEKMGETLVPKVEHLIPQIDSLVMAVRALSENKAITRALYSLEKSAKNLEETSVGLKQIMNNSMPEIVGNVNTMTTNLASTSEKLNKVDFVNTVSKIDSVMDNINNITESINNQKGSLGLLINDKSLYTNLTNTSNNANLLMIDIKEKPSRYVHFSVFGKSEKK